MWQQVLQIVFILEMIDTVPFVIGVSISLENCGHNTQLTLIVP